MVDDDRIEHIFKFMEYDQLSEKQLDLVESFERQWNAYASLSQRQVEILEDIFQRAAESA